MPFKLPRIQPDFSSLFISLSNSKQQVENNALYQTIFGLIKKIIQSQGLFIDDGDKINAEISAIKATTVLTVNDETKTFANSRQLLAGSGIAFNDAIAGKRTISATGSNGYWTPLTDGNVDETDLIFAAGESIAVFVPT